MMKAILEIIKNTNLLWKEMIEKVFSFFQTPPLYDEEANKLIEKGGKVLFDKKISELRKKGATGKHVITLNNDVEITVYLD
ncbi:hypothetical protein MT996_11570 [Ornithobacterium rhinotracheale]|uniref:hypothetical protein n=2 Tax=Ornithobacterium rhinotracheale TaxID=28251 RepID=UPI001FBB8655|nr:hypothetical protein [Ornithobacterium rhinotracheale]UOH77825.1 hypothetical protein MT996_11570 [Ornithobacterium rhinotracheale]